MYLQDGLTINTGSTDEVGAPTPAPDHSAAAVRVLEMATRSADELVVEAKAEAASLVATAQADADQLAAASQDEADKLTASARAEADQILAAARAEAEKVTAELEEQRTERTAEINRLQRLEQDHRDRMRDHLSTLMKQIDPNPTD